MELKLGFMSVAEIAEWSGRAVKYISDHKKKWCQKNLQNYADYELVHGGVNIIKIHKPIFQSSGLQEVRQKYLTYWGKDQMRIDSNKECWRKLSSHMTHELKNSTGYQYVSLCRREDFGVARKTNKYKGKKGSCRYVFCKKVNNEPVLFTEEEYRIKSELAKRYLKSTEENNVEMQALAKEYKNGEITAEEYAEVTSEIVSHDYGWIEFQTALEEAIGCETDFFIEIEEDVIIQMESGVYDPFKGD